MEISVNIRGGSFGGILSGRDDISILNDFPRCEAIFEDGGNGINIEYDPFDLICFFSILLFLNKAQSRFALIFNPMTFGLAAEADSDSLTISSTSLKYDTPFTRKSFQKFQTITLCDKREAIQQIDQIAGEANQIFNLQLERLDDDSAMFADIAIENCLQLVEGFYQGTASFEETLDALKKHNEGNIFIWCSGRKT